MESRFLEQLQRRVLVFDGAMGTSIQARSLTAEDFGGKEGFNDYLVLTRPGVIEEIHSSFLEVGCDALETNTFGGNRLKMEEYGLGEQTHALNVAAARLARRVADRYSTPDHPRFVVGSMGPTGMLPSSDDPSLSKITFDQLSEIFREQAAALVEGGCDALLIETSQDILEVKAAIDGIRRAFAEGARAVPLMAQVTLDVTGRMLLGTEIGAVLATLSALPIDAIGLNCSTGPEHMREPIRYLCENTTLPISVIPNAGLPLNVGGQAVYPLEPEPMAQALYEFVTELGVTVVGGCCGTTPAHLKRVVELVGSRPPKRRLAQREPSVSSGVRAVSLRQEPPPLLVGERVNSQGSRKVKSLLLEEDYDGVLQVARQQQESGAHVLDVCVALTERADEAAQMSHVVKKLSMGVETPLVIDTTEADVARDALERYPGRAIINSINLENGRQRIDAVVPLAVRHGAALVALTIDEEGMAHTAERKFAIARRIEEIVNGEFGLPPDALIFDVLTFPVTTGQQELARAGIETIEGIRRVKEGLPGVFTILGVSNVSFGVAPHARAALNSVFLYHAVEAGLDLAIVNPAHITPYMEIPTEQRELCDDLIFCRREDALPRFIAFYESQAAPTAAESATDPTEGMPAEEKIHYQILHRKKEGIEALLDEALTRHSPVEVLNDVLLPAMKDVGDRFGAGELILPFVLQSAEVMKRAVAHLEQFLEKTEGYTKGKVVLATVFGDVHDIGKNLVNTILSNNGYTVYDLGKQVPINVILDKAVEVDADAIGLSALLVSTSKQMPLCVQELQKRGLSFPVMVGGAAINRAYGRRILFVEGEPYTPGVFYGRDAFEGLEIMDQLTNPDRREAFVNQVRAEAEAARVASEAGGRSRPVAPSPRRPVAPSPNLPEPPFWGSLVLEEIDLEAIYDCFDLKSLFRLSWGAKNKNGADDARLLPEEDDPGLERLKIEAREQGTICPRAVYGYFPCQADEDTLLIYDLFDRTSVRERFVFPRQRGVEEPLCLADYFASVGSGRMDVVALQCVTVGDRATEIKAELQAAGDYSHSYYLHGFATQAAEATAEWLHQRIRRELGLGPNQGRRYSWGYGAIPDLADHEKLFRLIPAAEALGMELTEAHQLVPEESTAAIVVHHPQATYFAMGLTREEQLIGE